MSRRAAEDAFNRALAHRRPPSLSVIDGKPPTRRQLYLRRKAANRSRAATGWGHRQLPDIRPGKCEPCEGWGVIGQARVRCPTCDGTGG